MFPARLGWAVVERLRVLAVVLSGPAGFGVGLAVGCDSAAAVGRLLVHNSLRQLSNHRRPLGGMMIFMGFMIFSEIYEIYDFRVFAWI